jgi:hypothetical protein
MGLSFDRLASLFVLVFICGCALSVILRRRHQRTCGQVKKRDESLICRCCGYDLQGLTLPRCPECGTLRGFSVPMARLGLSEQEIREWSERRARPREAQGDEGHPADP